MSWNCFEWRHETSKFPRKPLHAGRSIWRNQFCTVKSFPSWERDERKISTPASKSRRERTRKNLKTNSDSSIPFRLVSKSRFSPARYQWFFRDPSSKNAHLPSLSLSPWSLAFLSTLCFPTRYFKATFPFSRWIPSSRVSFPVCTLARSHSPGMVGKQASRMQRFSSGHLETVVVPSIYIPIFFATICLPSTRRNEPTTVVKRRIWHCIHCSRVA